MSQPIVELYTCKLGVTLTDSPCENQGANIVLCALCVAYKIEFLAEMKQRVWEKIQKAAKGGDDGNTID